MTRVMLRTRPAGHTDNGAVLITMLLIVTIMSAVAVALIDDIRFSVRRATGAQAGDQARWYALGAEMLALRVLEQTLAASPDKISLDQPWNSENSQFLVPGGLIDARLSDGTNCFNVNSLRGRDTDDDGQTGDEANGEVQPAAAAEVLNDLLRGFDLPEADRDALSAAVTDWVDSNSRPTPGGAEDFDYLSQSPPYRTPNTLITDVSSLRAVKGMTPQRYALLSDVLCARPDTLLHPLNINTLTGENGAALLAAYLGEDILTSDAVLLLQDRPDAGFASVDALLSTQTLAGKQVPDNRRPLLAVTTRYFALNGRVVYGETDLAFSGLFALGEAGDVRLVTRRFGEDG